MERLKAAAAGRGKAHEDDRRHEDHDEGARHAGKEADDGEGPQAVGGRHRRRQQCVAGERQDGDRPLAPLAPIAGGKDRADEIADIVRRSDQTGIGGRKADPVHHGGQDRRIDEAADAHGGGHGDHTGKGVAERRRNGGIHRDDLSGSACPGNPLAALAQQNALRWLAAGRQRCCDGANSATSSWLPAG